MSQGPNRSNPAATPNGFNRRFIRSRPSVLPDLRGKVHRRTGARCTGQSLPFRCMIAAPRPPLLYPANEDRERCTALKWVPTGMPFIGDGSTPPDPAQPTGLAEAFPSSAGSIRFQSRSAVVPRGPSRAGPDRPPAVRQSRPCWQSPASRRRSATARSRRPACRQGRAG